MDINVTQPNKSSALIALGTYPMTDGGLVKVRYINSFGHIDCLVALGTGNGVGPDFYTILSDGGEFLVTRIVTTLPDISQAVFGEVYLLTSEDGIQRCHLSEDGEWETEDVLGDHIVTVSEGGGKFFISGGKVIGGLSSQDCSFKIEYSDELGYHTYTLPLPRSPYKE